MGTAHGAISIFYTPIGGEETSLGLSLGTIVAEIETKALNIGKDQFVYFIDQVTSHITGAKEVGQRQMILEISGAEHEDGPFKLLDTIDLNLEDPGYTDPPGMRYYKLKYIDPAVGKRWKLHGFDVYGEPGGDEY